MQLDQELGWGMERTAVDLELPALMMAARSMVLQRVDRL